MDKTTRIRTLLRSIAGTERTRCTFRLMEVTEVEGDRCRARIGDFELPGIRLASIAGGAEEGLLLTPATGSIVLVADLSDGELRELNAIGYSTIDALRYHRGNTTVEADSDTVSLTVGSSTVRVEDGTVSLTVGSNTVQVEDGAIRLGGEDNGGLVQIKELSKSLTSLQIYCETLKMAVAKGLKAVANGAAGAEAFDTAMKNAAIKLEKMENKKVTH